jgi:cytochrome c oxidase subunit III
MSVHSMSHDSSIHDDPTGPPHIHHMDSVTAYGAGKFGMWLFLATELLLFGVMFTSFAIFRWMNLEEFHLASKMLDWRLGAFNTAVLLFSSYTAVLAVDAGHRGDNKSIKKNVSITIFCGVIFLIVKSFEYKSKIEHGLYPNGTEFLAFQNEGKYGLLSFFGLYFVMTGIHALHVIIGMILLWWYALRPSMKGRFSERYSTPVELSALYWHLVDLIWIYLFPLLYLVG